MPNVTNRLYTAPASGIIASILPLLVQQSALATQQPPPSVSAAVAEANCGILARANLATLQDAPTRITEAKWVRERGDAPAYCRVRGPFEPPAATTRYYDTVRRLMGGRANTQDFYRLFMVPGMGHCAGGDGAWSIDYLSHLERWVEQGKAPEELVGWHLRLPPDPATPQHFPPLPGEATFSRPVYPYPLRAMYKGAGDPASATSFLAVGGK